MNATQRVLKIRKLMVQYAKSKSNVTRNTLAILIALNGGLV